MTALELIAKYNDLIGNKKGDALRNNINPEENITKQDKLCFDEVVEYQESLKDYLQSPTEENLKNLIKECSDVIVVFAGMMHRLNQKPEQIMEQVNQNNFEKFVPSTDLLEDEANHYKSIGVVVDYKGFLPYISIISSYDQIGNDGKEYPKGKQLKPSYYKKLNLEIEK